MAFLNVNQRVLETKIVYYGAGLSGKTTNLQQIKQLGREGQCGEMMSLNTAGDRTLFFDYMPFSVGKVNGCDVRIQLFTVPGQAKYSETRRRVLKDADGVVLVLDSQSGALERNREILRDLQQHMKDNGLSDKMPIIVQLNKRDLPTAMKPAELMEAVGLSNHAYIEAVACDGRGVFETLKEATRQILDVVRQDARRSPDAVARGKESKLDGAHLHKELDPEQKAKLVTNGTEESRQTLLSADELEDEATKALAREADSTPPAAAKEAPAPAQTDDSAPKALEEPTPEKPSPRNEAPAHDARSAPEKAAAAARPTNGNGNGNRASSGARERSSGSAGAGLATVGGGRSSRPSRPPADLVADSGGKGDIDSRLDRMEAMLSYLAKAAADGNGAPGGPIGEVVASNRTLRRSVDGIERALARLEKRTESYLESALRPVREQLDSTVATVESLAELPGKLAATEGIVTGLEGRMSAAQEAQQTALDGMAQQVRTRIEDGVTALTDSLESQGSVMQQQLGDGVEILRAEVKDVVEGHLAPARESIEELTAQLDAMTARVDGIPNRFEELEAKLGPVPTHLEGLRHEVAKQPKRFSELESRLDAVADAIDASSRASEDRLSTMAKQVTLLGKMQKKLEESQKSIDSGVQQLQSELKALTSATQLEANRRRQDAAELEDGLASRLDELATGEALTQLSQRLQQLAALATEHRKGLTEVGGPIVDQVVARSKRELDATTKQICKGQAAVDERVGELHEHFREFRLEHHSQLKALDGVVRRLDQRFAEDEKSGKRSWWRG